MAPITALLSTRNDARRLGRALETLFPCDEILVVDHHSEDATCRIAALYGARVVTATAGAPASVYLRMASHEWILCLQPNESISERLQATLYEWRPLVASIETLAFGVTVREEKTTGWMDHGTPETRLVTRGWNSWSGMIPVNQSSHQRIVDGELLRFSLP